MPAILLAALLAAPAVPADSPAGSMGTLSLPVTGSAECQRRFTEGLLALHSFMYSRAHEAFQAAAKSDPACAMARWGDAMAYSHPVWGEEDQKQARAALAEVKDEARLGAKERAWLSSARALWGEGDKRARHAAWLRAAERMHREFPSDDEASLGYALALIGNSDNLREVHRLMDSAALSMEVLQRHPDHPGAAHYLIHACDSPDHAILALPAARRYAQIAPSATHALHMPSHIFVQLGMYQDVVASNIASWDASEVERRRTGGSADSRDWHSYSWLADGALELGQRKRAKEMLSQLQAWLPEADGPFTRWYYAAMLHKALTSADRWAEVDALLAPLERPLPLEAGEAKDSVGCALHSPVGGAALRPPFGLRASAWAADIRAEVAMRKGDEAAVARALDGGAKYWVAMKAWAMRPETQERRSRFAAALIAGARAYKARTEAAQAEAAQAFRRYAEIPESSPSGPSFEPPPQQLLGDILLAAGKHKEALAAYDDALAHHPNLSRSLLGAARAAKGAGELITAAERYAALAKLWEHADPDLPELAEVQAGARVTASATARH